MMTEKRFKLFVGKYYGVQKVDGEVIFDSIRSIADADVLVEWLNDITNRNKELKHENEQLKKDLKSYQNMVKQYINLHIDKIRKRYVNPTKEEVAERTRIIRDLEQLKKELQK
jgi:hypothetical protein